MSSIVDKHGGGEYVGLREAVQRFGLPYPTLRAYIASGRLKASKTPNNRIWLKVKDIEALYERVEQKATTKQTAVRTRAVSNTTTA